MTEGQRSRYSQLVLRQLPGILFLLAVVWLLGQLLWQGYQWLRQARAVPLTQVIIHGQLNYLDGDRLRQLARQQGGNFFTLDVQALQRHLDELPWVDQVRVRKQWPATLHLYVTEQQPVALWNDDLLLNVRGEVFSPGELAGTALPLPHFYGPEGSERELLQQFYAFERLLQLHQQRIDAMMLSARYAWQLRLANGIQLRLGQKDNMARLHRFLTVLPAIRQSAKGAIDYVDLRYDTGMAVGWKNNDENV